MPSLRLRRTKLKKACIAVVLSILAFRFIAWKTWFQSLFCANGDTFATNPFCLRRNNDWNLLYHLGGNGPWIPRAPAHEGLIYLPPHCSIEQVHMLSRHAERYPTKNAGARHIALLQKLKHQASSSDLLKFLDEWLYFTDTTNPAFENLTSNGPYAGTLQATATGRKMKKRYGHLISPHKVTDVWTCSSPRDIETARHFASGFFGKDWESSQGVRLHIIPETADRGANTLTPSQTCLNYIHDELEGHDYGHAQLSRWQNTFSPAISSRLRRNLDDILLTPIEIYSMMEMCGFELLSRGTSPWCDVFTPEEWVQFEYARDLLHFYRAGPGNKYAGAMGWLWLNATLELLLDDSKRGVHFSFVHDSDLVAVIAAMGILDEVGSLQSLPVDRVKQSRRWRISDVIPMGGHMIFEKIVCDDSSTSETARESYTRLIINDGLFDLEEAIGKVGVAGGLFLQDFKEYLEQRGKEFGSFADVCGLPPDMPSRITFYGQ